MSKGTLEQYYSTGRRKEATARVFLRPGKGVLTVNRKPAFEHFTRVAHQRQMLEPLEVTDTLEKFDVLATVSGGGITGQAGAMRLGIARALVKVDEATRSVLRKGGMLTRDPRMKERKKYGQRGARRKFQFSKR